MRRVLIWSTLVLVAAPALASAQSDQRVRIIVRGDDFGSTHASNEAMVEAFDTGIMTSASVLVPGPWFSETAAMLRLRPRRSVGIHLTLTSEWNRLRWGPASVSAPVPSLIAPDGALWGFGYGAQRPADWPSEGAPWAEHDPDPAEAEREFRAQIERARAAGIRIDYLDCHMGVGCRPALLPITRKLARENCVGISSSTMFAARRFSPDYGDLSPAAVRRGLIAALRGAAPGLWLYVGHPAVDSSELRAVDSGSGERWALRRSSVLAAWTDPRVRAVVEELGIELTSMRQLFDYEACTPRR